MRIWITLLLITSTASADFLADFPHLKSYLWHEPASNIRLGFGLTPLRNSKTKFGVGFSPLIAIWDIGFIEWEMLNVQFSSQFLGGLSVTSYNSILMRSTLKIKVGSTISLGPLIGFEFLNFSSIRARLFNEEKQLATRYEPYSTSGMILGGMLSERFSIGENLHMQINEIIFLQNYQAQIKRSGWIYDFEDRILNQDTSVIHASLVFMIEVNFLY